MIVIVLVVLMPLAAVWALARSARLRGPAVHRESRREVGPLVTEAIPEEQPEDDEDAVRPDDA